MCPEAADANSPASSIRVGMDSAPADKELQGLVDKLEGENQLLQVKNAHLLNLLTESCSNCKRYAPPSCAPACDA